MDITPVQREKIQQLIENELRDAVSATPDRADSAAVAGLLADRRRALEESTQESSHDAHDALAQAGEGEGIGEQR
jgi:hypothetical protein